ncbi:MAG: TatD family hydrolase [Acidimicrobiia bacterium]|nr:TatD family hydrolase [Acidimicrobiia bacterium]
MPNWVDTHCHLFATAEAPAALLERAAAAGVEWVVCPGTDAATSQAAAELAAEFQGTVLATAGLHPHDAKHWPQQRDAIEALAVSAAAIGECGLDFYRDLSPRDEQLVALRDQLQLAVDLDKPVVVHCRDAFAELHQELERSDATPRVILHCWTGGPRWTKRFDELGVTFSFAGPVAFEKGDTVRLGAAVAPRDRTMVETDTPYLSPPPYRGEDNEPARVVLVGEALADVWELDPSEVASLTVARAAAVFGRD